MSVRGIILEATVDPTEKYTSPLFETCKVVLYIKLGITAISGCSFHHSLASAIEKTLTNSA